MPTGRWCSGAAVLNGIIYVIGGNTSISGTSDVVEAYDPAHNSWTIKAPLPIADAPVAVAYGSFIYALGGYNSGSGRIANVYRYDPKTNTWTTRHPMKIGRTNPGVGTRSRSTRLDRRERHDVWHRPRGQDFTAENAGATAVLEYRDVTSLVTPLVTRLICCISSVAKRLRFWDVVPLSISSVSFIGAFRLPPSPPRIEFRLHSLGLNFGFRGK